MKSSVKESDNSDYVPSYAILGRILSFTRATLSQWGTTYEDAPKLSDRGHSVSAWRDFLSRHPELGTSHKRKLPPGEVRRASGDIAKWKLEKTKQEARKLKFANDVKEGRYILKEYISDLHARMASGVKRILRQKLENEYPSRVAGLDQPSVRELGKQLVDEILIELQPLGEDDRLE